MKKSLVIVESPSKAKTIHKYLGSKYAVLASIGHVKDLPKNRLGIDMQKGFEPEYVVIKGKKKVLAEIKEAAGKADRTYLATDPDREGEAIAWHIAEELNGGKKKKRGSPPIYRVLFNEITERAIRRAMEEPGEINLKKVNAQQARRILDRLVGYMLSPLLWEKVRRGLSAGRVQSVAVRLICEREREIASFVKEEYWSVEAKLEGADPPPFVARVVKREGKEVDLKTAADADAVLKALSREIFVVASVEKKDQKRNPAPPFITSRLQQEAARKLGFTSKKTMMIAQQLYEGVELGDEGPVGLITYMRTDSTRVSSEAQQEALAFIAGRFGAQYRPQEPNIYRSKKGAQEAHEAIRPTSIERDPEKVRRFLTREQNLLYKLIWNRFVASQMTHAQVELTRAEISAGPVTLRASGSIVRFPGFMAVYTEGRDEGTSEEEPDGEGGVLPPLEAGQRLGLLEVIPKQHFTQPRPRYNEALLIRDLEEKGIGRPSTYHTITSTIQERKYVEKREGRFFCTDLGKMVNDLLVAHFPDILDVGFTAQMESELDEIEEGEKEWVETVRDFYHPFSKDLEKAQVEMRDVKREEIPTDIVCEKCGNPMVIRWGRLGRFLACRGYPECRNTKEFVEEDGRVRVVEPEPVADEICEKCGKPMVIKTGRFGRFLACSGYPDCSNTRSVGTGVLCPEEGCGGNLVEKRSRRGKLFFACSNYPRCKFALWDRPISKACPSCGAPFLVEKRSKEGGKILCRKQGCSYQEIEAGSVS